MNDVTALTRSIGLTLEIAEPDAWFADPAARAALKAMVDEHLVVHVILGGPLSEDSMGAMAHELGCPRGDHPERPGTLKGYPFIADFCSDGLPDDGRERIAPWIETLHFDGESAYSIQANRRGVPLAANRFVDMRAVWRDLPEGLKSQVRGRMALVGPLPPTNRPMSEAMAMDAARARRAPMVIAHPRTGEPVLRPPKGPGSLVEDMAEAEGRALIAELWARTEASPHAFEARVDGGSMVIWEGVAAAHTNPSFPRAEGRHTWFCTVPGDWKGFAVY